MNKQKILIIGFANEIKREEIHLFRGAVINAMQNANLLFHNHDSEDKLRYSYPLIQYKRIHRKAAIVCIGEGTEVIGEFFSAGKFDVLIGNRPVTLEVDSVKANQSIIQIWQDDFTYRIRTWLPLNQINYGMYSRLDGIAEKYSFLERMLTGNILSFAKGVGIHFDKQVQCCITAADEPRLTRYKGVKMMSFDVEFKSNVSLPDYIGLGKGVSLGCGTVVRKYEKNSDNNE